MNEEERHWALLHGRYANVAAAHKAAKTPAKRRAAGRPKNSREADAKHYGALADAARQQAVAASWDRPMRAATRGKTSSSAVKLHPGWDAAFKSLRAS